MGFLLTVDPSHALGGTPPRPAGVEMAVDLHRVVQVPTGNHPLPYQSAVLAGAALLSSFLGCLTLFRVHWNGLWSGLWGTLALANLMCSHFAVGMLSGSSAVTEEHLGQVRKFK